MAVERFGSHFPASKFLASTLPAFTLLYTCADAPFGIRRMSDELLSDVLTRVRLTGAVVFQVRVRGPWCMQAGVNPAMIQSVLPAGTRHLVAFHIALKGHFLARCGNSGSQTVNENRPGY